MDNTAKTIYGVMYFNAIVCPLTGGTQFAKYHNIRNKPAAIARFERFVISNLPWADHINYYDPDKPKGAAAHLYCKKLEK